MRAPDPFTRAWVLHCEMWDVVLHLRISPHTTHSTRAVRSTRSEVPLTGPALDLGAVVCAECLYHLRSPDTLACAR